MAQVLKDDIREKILESALEEFYQHGFTGAVMRNIARQACIPTGLIYSYYDSKDTLFREVLRPVRYTGRYRCLPPFPHRFFQLR